ncbi:hypothetical protein RN001_003966 [Aquatica leii]|uniref:Uncharacterized protein n=1 Tax=Aquatica leii TaxID=1421715 RepID=A0AAN7PGD2_9COLE|nr:hypothetical protein RN001_003966 [Aquatica leii]
MFRINVLFFIFNVFLVQTDKFPPVEEEPNIEYLHETCTKLVGVSDEEVRNYRLPDKSQKMMCYMLCIGIHSKWANPDGTMNYDYIVTHANEQLRTILLPTIEKCRNFPRADECETTYNFHLCVYEHDPEPGSVAVGFQQPP